MPKRKKLLITGGHVTPALAVIDEIHEQQIPCDIVFVGRKFINDRENSNSFEYNEVTKRNIKFIHLSAGRFTRLVSLKTLVSLFKIPAGFVRAFQILTKEKPDYILSFGGYLALPVAVSAYLKRIPIYTHEQTVHPGLSNRTIAKLATEVFVAFEESKQFIPQKSVIFTGNPIRKEIFEVRKKLVIPQNTPCIYITGGSMGAHSINTHIERLLPELLKTFMVIHQTGNVQEFHDFERMNRLKQSLPADLASRYFPQEHFLDDEIGSVYAHVDFVIGRAGANTFFELLALKKPAIFIPLPWSAHDEQRKQAHIFKEKGIGEMFEQNRPSIELLNLIFDVHNNLERYKHNFASLSLIPNHEAAHLIVHHIFKD